MLVSFRKGYLWAGPERLDSTEQPLEAALPQLMVQLPGWGEVRVSATGWDLFVWSRDSD